MKRTFVCITLLGAMLATGIILYFDTERVTADISARVAELPEISEHSELERAAESISADWEDFCAKNIFLTNNECAFEISEVLVRIISEIKTGDDDITEECITAERLIDMYNKSRSLSLENVF